MADTPNLEVRLKAIDELTPVMARAVEVMASQTSALVSTMEKLADGQKAPKQQTEQLNAGMINLASTMQVVGVAVELASSAWGKIEASIGKAIDEAEEAEKAQRRLSAALVATGMYTEANVESIDRYANKIKEATGYADEQVKVMVAQGIQMGLSIEKSQEMEGAARKLALATGKDVNEAFTLLSATIAGQSRGLAKILPQVKDLTDSQLKSGAAADMVNRMFASLGAQKDNFATVSRKAKTAVDDVYKAFGEIIIQNPIVIEGFKKFADMMIGVAKSIQTTHQWIVQNKEVLMNYGEVVLKVVGVLGALVTGYKAISFAGSVMDALSTSMKLYGLAGTLAANGINVATLATTGLRAAITFLTGPIGLAITAATALTAVFVKWPGMLDQIVGGLKGFAGMAIEAFSGIVGSAAKLAGVFNKDLAATLNRAKDSMQTYADKLQLAGVRQIEQGEATNKAKDMTLKAVVATEEHTAALDENMKKASEATLANLTHAQSYAGIVIGSQKLRDSLKGEVEDRDQDLAKFSQYLDSKKRLAISKAEEQQLELSKVRAKEIGGSGGEESAKANADLAIRSETQKQAQLKMLREKGVIDQKQLNEELYESEERIRKAQLTAELSHQQALADVLQNGPSGFEAQKQIRQRKYDDETQSALAQAERLGATEEQMNQIRQQRKLQAAKSEYDLQRQHDQLMIDQANQTTLMKAQALGETPEALALKQQAEQQAFQMKLQQMTMEAQAQGATQQEINSMKQQQEAEHKAAMVDLEVSYYDRQAQMYEKSGDDWDAFLARRQASVAKQGAILGNLQAVTNSQYFKAEMQMLGDLSSLRSSKDKKQFEAGKAAAIAQATVQTFLGATQAFTSLSSIPIIGPVLGAAAAAAAVASGMNQISQIKAQQFQGGQADSGMDSIPQALTGKSFILSAGERVVQPTANKDLTEFLNKEKVANAPGNGGGSRGGNTYHITVNAGGLISKSEMRPIAEELVKQIREMSERGTPIMSSKGLT